MQYLVQLAVKGKEWTAEMDVYLADFYCEEAVARFGQFFDLCLQAGAKPEELLHAFVYIQEKYFDCSTSMTWEDALEAIILYGDYATFALFLDNGPNLSGDDIYQVILLPAVEAGTETLRTVLYWLEKENIDLEELLEDYEQKLNTGNELDGKILRELRRLV